MEPRWLEWAKQIQAISQAGLTYSKDPYDLERFQQLRSLSVEILTSYTGIPFEQINELFANETGYATPKVDVRAVVFDQNKILMVRETTDGGWSLPGGWADIGLSAKEVAVKEVREESGYEVEATRLLAVLDKKFHPHPPSPYHTYKIFIACHLLGGSPSLSIETNGVGFFSEDALPPLSMERLTPWQLAKMFELHKNPSLPVLFD